MGEKYRRTEPSERRDLLIRAALRCLFKEGHGGLSIRRIASAAGVSVGLVNHHFGSIDALVAQAYRTLAEETLAKLKQALENAGPSAEERLDTFLVESFRPQMLDPDLLGAWVVFWSMQRHSPPMVEMHTTIYRHYLEILEDLLRSVADQRGLDIKMARLAAIGLSATLDGLWLELCLNPTTFTPEEALDICRRWVASFRNGAYV